MQAEFEVCVPPLAGLPWPSCGCGELHSSQLSSASDCVLARSETFISQLTVQLSTLELPFPDKEKGIHLSHVSAMTQEVADGIYCLL